MSQSFLLSLPIKTKQIWCFSNFFFLKIINFFSESVNKFVHDLLFLLF